MRKSRLVECGCICWIAGGLLVVTTISAFAFFQAGYFLDAPTRPRINADLIVALGGDNGARVKMASELYQQGFAPKVLLSGMEGGHAESRSYYLNWRARFLFDRGVPESALIFDALSASTWDEAVNTLHLMQAHNMRQVLVVSDPPHLRRLEWVWGKVFAGSGRQYRLVASHMDQWDAAHWWRNAASAQFVVLEYIKLGYYWVMH